MKKIIFILISLIISSLSLFAFSTLFSVKHDSNEAVRKSTKFTTEEIEVLKLYKLYDVESFMEFAERAEKDKKEYFLQAKIKIDYAESILKYLDLKTLEREPFDKKVNYAISEIKQSIFRDKFSKLSSFGYTDIKLFADTLFLEGRELYLKGYDIENLLEKLKKTYLYFQITSIDGYANHNTRVENALRNLKNPIKEASNMARSNFSGNDPFATPVDVSYVNKRRIRGAPYRGANVTPLDVSYVNKRKMEKLNLLLEQKEQFENLKILVDSFIEDYLGASPIEIYSQKGKSIRCIPFKSSSLDMYVILAHNSNIAIIPLNSISGSSKYRAFDYIKEVRKRKN